MASSITICHATAGQIVCAAITSFIKQIYVNTMYAVIAGEGCRTNPLQEGFICDHDSGDRGHEGAESGHVHHPKEMHAKEMHDFIAQKVVTALHTESNSSRRRSTNFEDPTLVGVRFECTLLLAKPAGRDGFRKRLRR